MSPMQRTAARAQLGTTGTRTVTSIIPGGVAEAREAGFRTGTEVVKLARQARLKELYEREARAYEAELNSLGLALVKPRD